MSVNTFVQKLVNAHRQGVRLEASPETGPQSVQEAYAVQAAVWDALAGPARSARPVAWKVGAASVTDTPLAAPVWLGMTQTAPATMSRERLTRPKVEAEIAVRFARDLPALDRVYRRDEVLAAIDTVFVAMELVETRLADSKSAGPLWCLADSLLNGALVLGDEIANWREQDFDRRHVRILADGSVLVESAAGQPLGDLFHCLSWWINHVGGAKAGDIVTTGAWNGAHDLAGAAQITVEFDGLGCARVGFS